jgi:hypothetical protein
VLLFDGAQSVASGSWQSVERGVQVALPLLQRLLLLALLLQLVQALLKLGLFLQSAQLLPLLFQLLAGLLVLFMLLAQPTQLGVS